MSGFSEGEGAGVFDDFDDFGGGTVLHPVRLELEAYGMENRPAAEIIEVVKDACAFAF